MDDLNNIYHSTQVEVAAAIDDSNELMLATAVQRIAAWLINRVIEPCDWSGVDDSCIWLDHCAVV